MVSVFSIALAATVVGKVTHLNGPLLVKKADGSVRTLGVNSVVETGDTLVTEKKTYARIKFTDNGEVTLRPKTQFKIDQYIYDMAKPQEDKAFFSMVKGGVRAMTGQISKRVRGDNYKLSTPSAVIGVRGTIYEARITEGVQGGSGIQSGLYLFVPEGSISVTNNAGVQNVGAGQYAYVRDMQTKPVILPANPGIDLTLPTNIQPKGKSQDGCVVR